MTNMPITEPGATCENADADDDEGQEEALPSFKELGIPDDLLACLEADGIEEPFPIQALAIPDALAGRDVCGQAKTGSGKTLAFGLPLVERTARVRQRELGSVVLVPTRELARQVARGLMPLAKVRDLKLVAVYGGVSIEPQIKKVRAGVDIVIATPGRLIDLLERKVVSVADVRQVVLDEADVMADMGFLPQVNAVLRRIERRHQTMLFSATLDGDVGTLISRYMHDPIRHEVASLTPTVEEMEHRFLGVHKMDKVRVAKAIASGADRVLIFVRTKAGADRLVTQLRKEGVKADGIHGGLPQAKRERALGDFMGGKLPVLVATDVAARGIHVDGIDVVIHYDPPESYKGYIHRSGRTARAGDEGLVVTLVLWDQHHEVKRLQRQIRVHNPIVEMFSNDERLTDLRAWEPPELAPPKADYRSFSGRPRRRGSARTRTAGRRLR